MSHTEGLWRNISRTRLKADIEQGIARVEQTLHHSTKSEVPLLSEAAEHLIAAGGKRFRPILTLLAAQFGDPHAPGVAKAAAAVELTHVATLHHDDVMDRAVMRRSVPSVNARWSNTIAVRSGNFLLTRAAQIVAELGEEAIRTQQAALSRLVRGQALEIQGPGFDADPVQHYLEVIAEKTGSLIALAGRLGALLSGADHRTIRVFSEFGERIGVAFQLADDLLDIEGSSTASGKAAGTDLRQGVATLPVLLLRSRRPTPGDPEERRLRYLLESDLSDSAEHHEALQLLRRHPVMAEARAETLSRAEGAREVLASLQRGRVRNALEDLCRMAADRVA